MGKFPERAFTSHFTGITDSIINEIFISEPFQYDPKKEIKSNDPRLHKMRALWDTGATHCVIKSSVAKDLGLKAISISNVAHAGGVSKENVFLVNLFLPSGVAIPFVRVTEGPKLAGEFEVIIGMDIITRGDFSITNVKGKTVVSFRMPSKKTIDYVAEIDPSKRIGDLKRSEKIRRNDPCYCGSRKKYKDCHGK